MIAKAFVSFQLGANAILVVSLCKAGAYVKGIPLYKVVIGMEVAASEFYEGSGKTYDLNFKEENNDGSQKISGDSLKNLYKSFVSEYPIVSIEDPFDQDGWEHYAKLIGEVGTQVKFVGGCLPKPTS